MSKTKSIVTGALIAFKPVQTLKFSRALNIQVFKFKPSSKLLANNRLEGGVGCFEQWIII